ncbi:calcium-activated potassium channel subunit beta-2 [Latimeria chalumnae]|uniref:calcium-activated potassium channel subunit beta-2 n=1 Tax=Latimeria chalumnae TaxID=7897 RepID=UPI0003C11CED|nr:PREDICTED: calcium-activated potassium channel subunit beta-1 [Latimeria chalumnae]|eukprot:XP_006002501.1 PREDICTED: calcium-activated potassium channel subunit beta-1 [Latimeria chalumnae]
MVTALRPGENRAMFLGIGMMVCSILMFFLLGNTVIPSYLKSVWTEESKCMLLRTAITEKVNCSYSCGSNCWKTFQYPCLQVYVNLSSSGQTLQLYHTEETLKTNSKCSYIPKYGMNYYESKALVESIAENFKRHQPFPCHYDPTGSQNNVILTRMHGPNRLLYFLFWPTCMLVGGIFIIVMVKITQYLSLLYERKNRISR